MYIGMDYTRLYSHSLYGVRCQRIYNCSKDMCEKSTGCQQITTGNMYIFLSTAALYG